MAMQQAQGTRTAQCDNNAALLNGGVHEWFTGSPPASVDDAESGTKLVSFTYASPAFQAATDDGDFASAAQNPVAVAAALASGITGYFRNKASGGAVHSQGTITGTGGGGDLEVENTSITAGKQYSLTNVTIREPRVST